LPSRHAFRAADLVVKTLLLAALVPNVPALRALTANRLAALNHGSIAAIIPGQDQKMVARTLRELAGEFGEIRVSEADNPAVEINLIGVNTSEILQQVIHVDDNAARRRLIKALLWEDFGITDRGASCRSSAPGRASCRRGSRVARQRSPRPTWGDLPA